MLTSKYILSKSFRSFNELFGHGRMESIPQICEILSNTEQAITFKDLGVISTSETDIWRPRTTRLFNFVKSLVDLETESDEINFEYITQDLFYSESHHIITTRAIAKDNSLLIDVPTINVYGLSNYNRPSHMAPPLLTGGLNISDKHEYVQCLESSPETPIYQ